MKRKDFDYPRVILGENINYQKLPREVKKEIKPHLLHAGLMLAINNGVEAVVKKYKHPEKEIIIEAFYRFWGVSVPDKLKNTQI